MKPSVIGTIAALLEGIGSVAMTLCILVCQIFFMVMAKESS